MTELRPTPEQLERIVEAHEQWARGENGGRRANLQDADLQDADLQDADLQDADLQDANLQRANLQDANLQDANLQDANLQRANLQRANLQDANLQDANLQDANLQRAYLRRANLQRANLQDANLQDAYLQDAYLQDAYLQRANLQRANLQDAYLQGTCLTAVLSAYAWAVSTRCEFRTLEFRTLVLASRTAGQIHMGGERYQPGHLYVAPWFSRDVATDCHPGLYLAGGPDCPLDGDRLLVACWLDEILVTATKARVPKFRTVTGREEFEALTVKDLLTT